jgi:hypothetical protein
MSLNTSNSTRAKNLDAGPWYSRSNERQTFSKVLGHLSDAVELLIMPMTSQK